jgi:4'-phosphopantetheinyl transferase
VPDFDGLLSGDVHVWRASLHAPDEAVARLRKLLSEEEVRRAGQFRFERLRRGFVVQRGILREILASYSGQRPEEIEFLVSEYGKPRLAESAGIEFNVSHSGNMVMYALAYRRRVGIDIEWLRPFPDALELARRFFSPEEKTKICAMPETERAKAFLTCWTRKEAYVKARGLGLSMDLSLFCVSVPPDGPALLYSDEPPAERQRWMLTDLTPGEAHVGCLAVEGPAHHVALSDWIP